MTLIQRVYDEMVEANWNYDQCFAAVEVCDAAYNAIDEDWADEYDTGQASEVELEELRQAWNALVWTRKELERAKVRRDRAEDAYAKLT